MADFSKYRSNKQQKKIKIPDKFHIIFVCQYAKSLYVMKNLPFRCNSYILN